MKKLPRGRHGLPPEFVQENQRERLIRALIACIHKKGYGKTTVGDITTRAKVSKADFYKNFENKGEVFVAAYDYAVEKLREATLEACESGEDWGQRVCAALSALLSYMVQEPGTANLVLVEGLSAGREFHTRYQEAVRSFVPILHKGAPAAAGGGQLPETTDEAVVGGIATLLARHVLAGEVAQLEEFFPEIAEFALTPYLGSGEARRIISAA